MPDIRALIVDDEPLARRGIRQLLAPYADVTVVGECRNGREALRALATLAPDLVFLDVQMPGLDGLEVIRLHGPGRMPVTVFVTAHDEFAVKAFEAQALDYLVKPLSETRFRATITRVRERLRLHDAVALAGRLSALLQGRPTGTGPRDPDGETPAPAGSITVPTDRGEALIALGDVDWIKAEDDHAVVHARGARYPVRASLAALEARLDPARFLRVHRSAVVRLDQVRAWEAQGPDRTAVVILRDGTRLAVSRRRLAQVKAMLRSGHAR